MTRTSQIAWKSLPSARSPMASGELLAPNRSGNFTWWAQWWGLFLDWAAPWGYEDETGFHYGELPSHRRCQS